MNKSDIISKNKDLLYRKSFVFVLDTINYNELLEKENKNLVAKKLLNASTSFGAYINEARNCKNNNISEKKIRNAQKEAQRIKYLLQLCKYSKSYPNTNALLNDITDLLQLLALELNLKESS